MLKEHNIVRGQSIQVVLNSGWHLLLKESYTRQTQRSNNTILGGIIKLDKQREYESLQAVQDGPAIIFTVDSD
jgi:hypothetical protein